MIDEQMRLTGSIGAAGAEFWGASPWSAVASPQYSERLAVTLNAIQDTDHAFRRAQPYRRARAYFSRLEQLARDGRIE